MELRAKRVYEEATVEDGRRVLVDRLWPRGVSKERARVDFWAREIAPSNELRRELGSETATLLFSSKVEELNNATALAEYLEERG